VVDARRGRTARSFRPSCGNCARKTPRTRLIEVTRGTAKAVLAKRGRPTRSDTTVRCARGLRTERVLMEPIRKTRLSGVIDHEQVSTPELRQFIIHRFSKTDRRPMMVATGQFRLQVRDSSGLRTVFGRAFFCRNPHSFPATQVFRARPARRSYNFARSSNGRVFTARRGLLTYLIPHLYPGREELP